MKGPQEGGLGSAEVLDPSLPSELWAGAWVLGARDVPMAEGERHLQPRCLLSLSRSNADRTQTGHVLGQPPPRDETVVSDRELSPVVFLLIRLLTHLAMLLGAAQDPQVQRRAANGVPTVRPLLCRARAAPADAFACSRPPGAWGRAVGGAALAASCHFRFKQADQTPRVKQVRTRAPAFPAARLVRPAARGRTRAE